MPKATENRDILTANERAAIAGAASASATNVLATIPSGTDNRVVRRDGTAGLLQDSLVAISDLGAMTGLTGLTLASGDIVLTTGGSLVDGRDLTVDGAILDAFRVLTIAASAEGATPPAAQTIRLTYQVKNLAGANVAAVHRLHIRTHDANMVPSVVGDITTTVVTGSAVSPSGQASLIMDTDATGLAVVDILDVSGVLAAAVNVLTDFYVVSGGTTNAARGYHTVITFA